MTPFVMVIAICLVFIGLILLLQGAIGRDINLEGDILPTADRANRNRLHPPERRPRRLMTIGLSLILSGALLGALWTSLAM